MLMNSIALFAEVRPKSINCRLAALVCLNIVGFQYPKY